MKFNHTAHKELWYWLADNPEAEKEHWPNWKINGGDTSPVIMECFACEYNDRHKQPCEECPLIWGNEGAGCCYNENDENNGIYNLWKRAKSSEERTRIARQIAELPVREGVECI